MQRFVESDIGAKCSERDKLNGTAIVFKQYSDSDYRAKRYANVVGEKTAVRV